MPRAAVVRCHYFRDTRVRREVDALLAVGFAVEVVCLRDRGESGRERRGSLLITRLPLRHRSGAGAPRLLGEYLVFFLLASVILTVRALRRRFDVVQVNSVPDALVFAAAPAKLLGARVVLDLQEPMPEFFATKFDVAMSHPLVRLVAMIEQASIRAADQVITPTGSMRRAFASRGADAEKIVVVMDGADETVFCPSPRSSAPARALPRRYVLISHGTIEPHYGLDTAIRATALLVADIPEVELQIIGDGSQVEDLQNLARRLGVAAHVRFSHGFVPEGDLVEALRAADVGVVAMRRDRFRDLTLAGKMLDFVAIGLPMVVSRTRSVEETLGPDCYEGFESGNADDLAAAVTRIHDDPARAGGLAAAAREQVRPIAWSVQRRRYQELVAALAADGSTRLRPPPPGAVGRKAR
jgi:glycosyltransferase involved in cell wall biosynthesis